MFFFAGGCPGGEVYSPVRGFLILNFECLMLNLC